MIGFRFLRFTIFNVLLTANLVLLLKGGGWLWLGFATFLTLSLPVNELFGDDEVADETTYAWFLNANLYLSLPLLLLNTLTLVALAAPTLPLQPGVLAASLALARAHTNGWDLLGGSLTLGLFYAAAALPAHELAHRVTSPAAQIVGRWIFAFNLDTTFPIAHVYLHHRYVGTTRDPATARRGENVYAFIFRTTCGQFTSTFRFEADRLRRKGHAPLSWRNRALRGQFMPLALCGLCFYTGAAAGLGIFLATAIQGKLLIELMDYIAHYGLVRCENKSIEPRHSWNMRRAISGAILLNASRHSHHHLHPAKPFWALAAESNTPNFPYGHTAMMMLAAIPPLWNAIVDPLLRDWDLRLASSDERAILAGDGKLLGITETSRILNASSESQTRQ